MMCAQIAVSRVSEAMSKVMSEDMCHIAPVEMSVSWLIATESFNIRPGLKQKNRSLELSIDLSIELIVHPVIMISVCCCNGVDELYTTIGTSFFAILKGHLETSGCVMCICNAVVFDTMFHAGSCRYTLSSSHTQRHNARPRRRKFWGAVPLALTFTHLCRLFPAQHTQHRSFCC